MMLVKLWSEGYKCTKTGIFCRTENIAMTLKIVCTYAHYVTLGSRWKMASNRRVTDLEKIPVWISKNETDKQQAHSMIQKIERYTDTLETNANKAKTKSLTRMPTAEKAVKERDRTQMRVGSLMCFAYRSQFRLHHCSQRTLTEIVSKITPNLGLVL